MFLFSKLIHLFFGYSDPVNISLGNKINNYRGDLRGISAKKEALPPTMHASTRDGSCYVAMSIVLEFYD